MENSEVKEGFKFNTITDIVSDPIFQSKLKQKLIKFGSDRFNRLPAKPGYKYKTDWYDAMKKNDHYNYDFFIKHIGDIWLKRSSLSMSYRMGITYICEGAFAETVTHYENKV